MPQTSTHKPKVRAETDRAINVLISLLVGTRWVLAVFLVPIVLSIFIPDILPLEFGGDPEDPDARTLTVHVGMTVEDYMSRAAVVAESLKTIIQYAFTFYFISQILGVLYNVNSGEPFARDNGVRLRRVGYAGAAAQISIYALWIVFKFIDAFGMATVKGMSVDFNPAPWIGVLSVFALATVFREGTELKEEQDLTV